MLILFRCIVGYLFIVAGVFGVLSLIGKFDDTFARLAKNDALASRLRLAFGSSLLILSAALLLALFFADNVLLFCNSHNIFSFSTIKMTLLAIVLLGGVLIAFGKGDWLISFYSYVPDAKLADYHLWRLRLVVAFEAFLFSSVFWPKVIFEELDKKEWGFVVVAVIVVVWILLQIFGHKWTKKKVIRN